jgi:hypothetical protein
MWAMDEVSVLWRSLDWQSRAVLRDRDSLEMMYEAYTDDRVQRTRGAVAALVRACLACEARMERELANADRPIKVWESRKITSTSYKGGVPSCSGTIITD